MKKSLLSPPICSDLVDSLVQTQVDLEAIKQNYYITENEKVVWSWPDFEISSQQIILHLRPQLNKYVQDKQVLLTSKP